MANFWKLHPTHSNYLRSDNHVSPQVSTILHIVFISLNNTANIKKEYVFFS